MGAIAPSSRYLAAALVAPFAGRQAPARVLEVGAGTGAVTRALARYFGSEDHLDVCEIDPKLADILDRQVLGRGILAAGHSEGRVTLIRGPVQAINAPNTYDFVVSSLPLNSFSCPDVQDILAVIERNLKPDGVFSYFEYVGLRRLRTTMAAVSSKREIVKVSALLNRRIREHQVAERTVWLNVPPARARHWRFAPPNKQRA